MKIVMIYDQIQSGAGTKDDKKVPLQGKKVVIGPAVMMEPFLKKVDGHVIACLYCGTEFYQEDKETVSRKFCAMAKKMEADVVICGPCYNYKDYADMAAKVAYDMKETVGIPALTAMSIEVEETINEYKNKIPVVKMPKKGGTGLNDALRNICELSKALVDQNNVEELMKEYCY